MWRISDIRHWKQRNIPCDPPGMFQHLQTLSSGYTGKQGCTESYRNHQQALPEGAWNTTWIYIRTDTGVQKRVKTYLPYRLKNRLYPKVIWAKRSIILSMNIRHYVIIHFKPEYEMDNNAIERINRYISLSRRNSLFCGSHQGAKRAALIYSLACSCRQRGIKFLRVYLWYNESFGNITTYCIYWSVSGTFAWQVA